MNKIFCVLFAAALVGAALARYVPDIENPNVEENEIDDEASKLALTLENETKNVPADKEIFKPFCMDARNIVIAFLRESINNGAATLFNTLTDTVGQMNGAIAGANAAAAERGSAMVSQDAKQLKSAVGGLVQATAESAKKEASGIIENIKEKINVDTAKDLTEAFCNSISMQLKPRIDQAFNEYKNSKKSSAGPEFKDVISKTRNIDAVGCSTVRRVSQVVTTCNMLRTLVPSMLEFLNKS